MIYAAPSSEVEVAVDNLTPSLVGVVGVTVKDKPAGGAVVVARTTQGITEDPLGSGHYGKSDLVVPDTEGNFWLFWDSGVDTAPFASEEFVVTYSGPGPAPIPGPTTYTTAGAVRAFTSSDALDALGDGEIEKLIFEAERDIDNAVGAYTRDEATGLKFVPASLTTHEADVLSRATAAQVEYRHTMGPDFFIRAQHDSTKGPDYEITGRLPIVGPKTWRELEGSGLLKLTTTWSGSDDPPWYDFAYG